MGTRDNESSGGLPEHRDRTAEMEPRLSKESRFGDEARRLTAGIDASRRAPVQADLPPPEPQWIRPPRLQALEQRHFLSARSQPESANRQERRLRRFGCALRFEVRATPPENHYARSQL